MARRVKGVGVLVAGALACACVDFAAAVVIPPGGSAPLSGTTSGVVQFIVVDNSHPFEIRDGSNMLLFQGVMQERINRHSVTGKLWFYYRIHSISFSLPSVGVASVQRTSFNAFVTDVDYRTDGVGMIGPTMGSRSSGLGTTVTNAFSALLGVGGESYFCFAATDADVYGPGGITTITLNSGHSVVIPTLRPVTDSTPPIVEITSPGPFSCSCDPVNIIGTANDPEGFGSYTLDYAANPGGPWTVIATGNLPVVNGLLGVWSTTFLSQGYYFVRLTATNAAMMTSVFTTIMFVDRQFDVVDVRSPVTNGIYGGNLCFDGTVNDHCFDRYRVEYRPSGIGPFLPVDPVNPVYTSAVVNDPFATWSTHTGPTSVLDGLYDVRVTGQDICGHIQSQTRTVEVDNTAPVATITSPTNCSYRCGVIEVRGTADDANLAGWTLQYTGGASHGWTTIASGSASVINNVLANWNTAGLPRCAYTIRLIVSDQASVNCGDGSNSSEYTVSINVGAYADCNADGVTTIADFGCFQTSFVAGCP